MMKSIRGAILLLLVAGFFSCDLINGVFNLTAQHDNPNDPLAPVAAPVLSPPEGIVAYGTQVSMTCATEGSEIHYTTGDGTQAEPTITTGTVYSETSKPFLTAAVTFKAKAFKTGRTASTTTTVSYAVSSIPSAELPLFNPPAGTYTVIQSVAITCGTPGAAIRYTTDSSDPKTSATAQTYTTLIQLGTSTTIKAYATRSGLTESPTATAAYTINLPGQVATPAFSPAGGFYSTTQSVSISCATAGARILFTADGSDPRSSASALIYASPVMVAVSATLKAYAYLSPMTDSGVATAEYTLQAAAPTFAPEEGSYTSVTTVAISSPTTGAAVKYTTDASDPRSSSTAQTYAAPISLSATTVLKAYASKAGMADSNVSSAMYTITLPQVSAPVFDPNGGIFTNTQIVTITAASGATIKYTTDGSDPRNAGTSTYAAPIAISTSTVLKAFASKSGMRDSEVSVASFTINLPGYVATPVISPSTNIYTTAQTVSITCATADATIHYTTDGSVPTGSSTVYTGEFQVSTTTTIKAYADNGVDIDSGIASATLTFLVANPTFNPPSGAFTTIQSVIISSATPGAEIRSTTDNNDPRSSATAVTYSGPVQVASSTVLQAYARMSGMTDSATVSAAYIVNLPSLAAPVMDPPAGIYTSARTVSLSAVPSDSTIRYTVDNSDPRISGTALNYSSPIAVPATMTLKAYANKYNYLDSPVAEGTYTITGTVAAPTFSPEPGTYTTAQAVSLSTTTAGATIVYTTNGSTPNHSSTPYSGAFTVSATTTVQALAYRNDWDDSPPVTGIYTITGTVSAPTFSHGTGTYDNDFQATISCGTSGATIWYTLDGSEPGDGQDFVYGGPVTISATTTLKAVALNAGWAPSAVSTAVYTMQAAQPTMVPAGGTYPAAQDVTVSSATAGTTIRYTTEGETPSHTVGTEYTTAVSISATKTLRAIAYKSGYSGSTVSAETYTMAAPATPTGLAVGNATSASLDVSWNVSAGATSYQVYRDTVLGGGYVTQAYTGSTSGFTDSGRSAGTTYYYKVQATGDFGTSALSTAASGTTTGSSSWAKTYGGTGDDQLTSMTPTADGGCVLVGYSVSFGTGSNDAWVVKLDATGVVQWEKAFGGTGSDVGNCVAQTSDGGYIVSGSYNGQAWILRLNPVGGIVWQKTYAGNPSGCSSIDPTQDGGYIATVQIDSYPDLNILILKLDSSGGISWQKKITGGNEDYGKIRQSSDGGYLLYGTFNHAGGSSGPFLMMKLDSSGTVTWSNAMDGSGSSDNCYSMADTSDGGHIAAGWIAYTDGWIMKTDSNGGTEWQKRYGGGAFDYFSSISQTSDGGYIVGGYTASYGAGNGNSWMLKLDAAGAISWQKAFGGSSLDFNANIVQASDGGYLAAGLTNSYGAGAIDYWVIKITADGQSPTISTNSTATPTTTTCTDAVASYTETSPSYTGTDSTCTVTTTACTVTQQAP